MNFKNNMFKLILLIFSVTLGISISEIFARYLGLGNPLLYFSDPLVGYRLKPNQSEKRRNKAFVTSDFEGFRIDPDIKLDPKSKFIVFVGDSVTYGGTYIDNSDTFASLYCRLFNDKKVCLNNGVNSWGTLNMGRFISNFEIYSKRTPVKFILVILPGDERRNFRSFSDTPFWSNQPRQPKAINEIMRFILFNYINPILESPKSKEINEQEFMQTELKLSKQLSQSWSELDALLDKSKYPIDVVITPPRYWFEKDVGKKEYLLYNELLTSLKSKNIKNKCNLFLYIEEEYHPDLYVDSVHLSDKGHKLWSKKLKQCIKSSK